MKSFETFPEQDEAKRLLAAALAEPAHAYLLHGPPGVGKRRAALAFAGELLGDPDRVGRRAHPDLYVLEPLGEQIRIDPIRELRRDLHMRPFEADRRAYLILGAHLMNEDAADALLKDLEEPPPYATILLVADELGPLPETIRSRCQLVPFSRLTRGAVKSHLASRGLTGEELEIATRVAAGRLDRADRLRDEDAKERRRAVLDLARSVYADPAFEPSAGAKAVAALAYERAGQGQGRRREGGRRRAREAPEAGARAARPPRRAGRGARGGPPRARHARELVPRPRRRRRRGRGRRAERRPDPRALRGRGAGARRARRPRRRDGARRLALVRVPGADGPCARSALRPAAA